MDMIEIDGSVGEGGGQILRTSLALAMCTGQPFTLSRIRARRPKPGLMRQHLTCVLAAAEVCGAEVVGAELGSATLRFVPGPVRAGDYRFAVGSAGSCTLVLQTVWPALMLADAPSRLHLGGGTHNPMAPPFHFLQRAYAPLMRRLGAPASLTLRFTRPPRRCSLSTCWSVARHVKPLPSACHLRCTAAWPSASWPPWPKAWAGRATNFACRRCGRARGPAMR
jgi:hypothetical protein